MSRGDIEFRTLLADNIEDLIEKDEVGWRKEEDWAWRIVFPRSFLD